MPAGRPKKPRELAKATMRDENTMANGTKVPSMEVVPRDSSAPLPICPDDLSERGKTEWEKIWSAGHWLKDDQDYHWVAMIARAYDDMDAFRAQIQADGLMVTGYAGQQVANPLIAEIRKCESVIMKALSMLGFSPSDRARLGVTEVKRLTGLAALQEKARQR